MSSNQWMPFFDNQSDFSDMMRKRILLLVLLGLVLSVGTHAQNGDARALKFFNQQSSMYGFSGVISNTTVYVSAAIPVAMGIAALATSDDELFKATIGTVAGMAITTGLTYGLKYSINRPRPYAKYPDYINNIHLEDSPSMPSGHTSIAFASATSLCLQFPKWYVIVPSSLWALSVGYSRMNLGVHYPTDVLTGAVLGAGSAYLSYKLNQLIWRKTGNKKILGLDMYRNSLNFAYKGDLPDSGL